MNCARYELELTSLLDADKVGVEDLIELKRHAAACPECAGTSAMLEWLASGEARRDWVPDPGEAYWSTFGRRVRSGIEEVAPVPGGDHAPRRAVVGWIGAVAALLVVALGIGWFSWPRTSPPPVDTPSIASNPQIEPTPEEPPHELVEWLAAEEPLDPAFGESEGLLPTLDELDGLDEDGREALLNWLNERNAAAEGVS